MLYPVQLALPGIVTLYTTIKIVLHSVQSAIILLYPVQPAILPSYTLINTLLEERIFPMPGTVRYSTAYALKLLQDKLLRCARYYTKEKFFLYRVQPAILPVDFLKAYGACLVVIF
jgi:hypothetical protein